MDKIEKSFMFSGLDESEKKIVVDAMEEKKTFKNESNQNITVYSLETSVLFDKTLDLIMQSIFNLKLYQEKLILQKNS